MKYVEAGGDVRSTSANTAYMGVVFQGSIEDALAQAKATPDHGVPELNGRAELLAFLRVDEPTLRNPIDDALDEIETRLDQYMLIPPSAPPKPWDGLSPFSLEYAIARWPENFKHGG